jgi:hypothetical protein
LFPRADGISFSSSYVFRDIEAPCSEQQEIFDLQAMIVILIARFWIHRPVPDGRVVERSSAVDFLWTNRMASGKNAQL